MKIKKKSNNSVQLGALNNVFHETLEDYPHFMERERFLKEAYEDSIKSH